MANSLPDGLNAAGASPAVVVVQGQLAGAPTTGHCDWSSLSDLTIGVWEHTPGTSLDVETDEVFVVLSGDATVGFDDGSPAIDLRPGSLVRLYAGQHTIWTVRETLRKVFIA